MKAKVVTGVDNRATDQIRKQAPKFLQGRKIELDFSYESTWKVAKAGLALLAIGTLVYWAVCDISKCDFCVLSSDLTEIAQNLNRISSLF